MPAVTADPTTLARLSPPAAGRRPRPVQSLTTAPSGFEGEGFPVRRGFAGVDLAALDPFIMMDQMGSVDYGPGEPKGTSWHPHRGFETATYLLDGAFEHQDSNGGGGLITGGDTQWMTAGAGIHHIEAPPAELVARGGLFHGVQLWVNLPKAEKGIRPRYQDITSDRLTVLGSASGGSLVRVIAGELDGQVDVLVLGGEPIREPIAWYGPFVMNHRSEILQAFEDFQAGRLGRYEEAWPSASAR